MQQQWGLGEAVVMLRAQCFAWLWLIDLIPHGSITPPLVPMPLLGSHSTYIHADRPLWSLQARFPRQTLPGDRALSTLLMCSGLGRSMGQENVHPQKPPQGVRAPLCSTSRLSEKSVSLCVAPVGMWV